MIFVRLDRVPEFLAYRYPAIKPVDLDQVWRGVVLGELPAAMIGGPSVNGVVVHGGRAMSTSVDGVTAAGESRKAGGPSWAMPMSECPALPVAKWFPVAAARLEGAAPPAVLDQPTASAVHDLANTSAFSDRQFVGRQMRRLVAYEEDILRWARGEPIPPECFGLAALAVRSNPKQGPSYNAWIGSIVLWLSRAAPEDGHVFKELPARIRDGDPDDQSVDDKSIAQEISNFRRRYYPAKH